MQETPIFFPIAPTEFLKQMKEMVEAVVNDKLNQSYIPQENDHLPDKALLKASDVCSIFQILKPTIYDWLKQGKIKSFKINSRRFFLRADIEMMLQLKSKMD